ncbi:MAG: methionine--tRNA ligase [bacterium (Candidatus Ratteibacteria) CG_4_10_14_3_um_filter_41_18]|uniref:Methionine--tRNA ligase n=4 Tax=Candidatus Ratteibacteria TaxID=2979319 RepID=A0A2M7E8I7_9BACT|nr:MAG: methionine--tRNA ligase [Candidatus Omnitrophica bacterium CG1_02_41_171]PIV64052.1 MAG: methionine--tRNA ligase [bacterium (Candidatus Ratteibacteria) CG01_land_8_20_14_3_00_40_19]PIW33899.1 MAG: methionine--tRNA ligase [bacterium (Candidatus Ratteibacteria) CG15_BIG_FIL_POST_REV_8_21_14_020_41_12]PIW73865.1 MAG: methionine--tRNA ligase [bacterium (Candidatus Ratteibacteria) CG_4_8_14_3_um_filter_41_36]PIX77886.1 MAG: methionine--tRNA ligase [bacterium (Candidatus Ratteibacteria) CG_4_
MSKFYITTPLYYVNDSPHIGHAYTEVAADVLARSERLLGKDVFFLTGTDEHGQKIAAASSSLNLSPKELADRTAARFQKLWEKLNISYDRFLRTTEASHEKLVREVFDKIHQKGDLYLGTYKGSYCISCESYVPSSQLKENLCPDCGRKASFLEEPAYFFRLSKYQEFLLSYIRENPDFIGPKFREKEVTNFIRGGLTDLSITRAGCQWGILIKENFSIYVWFDALLNYLSGINYLSDAKLFERYWPPDVQFIGKDIIRFHDVIWPAILFSLSLPLPGRIFAHGWWVIGGEKISKSKGTVVSPEEIISEFGADSLRYFLLREVPFGLDGEYSSPVFLKRYNSDLANDLGNLLHRSLSLLETSFEGKIPSSCGSSDEKLKEKSLSLPGIIKSIEALKYNEALIKIWEIVGAANKYLDEKSPWRLSQKEAGPVLYNVGETLRLVALFLKPFLPETSKKIAQRLGIAGEFEEQNFREVKWGLLPPGRRIKKGEPIFPRKK